ncbi:hypothetical protein EMCRGX_G032188 [Ephydatia muelleri]
MFSFKAFDEEQVKRLPSVKYEPIGADGDQYPPLYDRLLPLLSNSVDVRKEPILGDLGVVLRGSLTAAECKSIIELSEKTGYQDATDFCHKYVNRWNDRFMTDDPELATFLWKRIERYIPAKVSFRGYKWEVDDLNTRFRFCRYRGEERHYFGPHCDGNLQVDETRMSVLTCMWYLNDASEFEGGLTNFIDFYDPKKIVYSLKPEAGLCVAFIQEDIRTYHEGTMVTKGKKYVMRTEVIYHMVGKETESD